MDMEVSPGEPRSLSRQAEEQHQKHALSPYELPKPHFEATQSHMPPPPTHLPDLKTVLSPQFQQTSTAQAQGTIINPLSSPVATTLPRIEPQQHLDDAGKSTEAAVASPSESSMVVSDDHGTRTKSGVSLADQEVRDVAEALIGLGGSVPSPSVRVLSHPTPSSCAPIDGIRQEQEPLLQLFTQAHPVPGAIINGSMSAYTGAKSLTPRFVRAGIDVAERNIGSPMVNAVGNVGRTIGAERAARWYLTPREQADASSGDEAAARSKRRRVDEHMDVEAGITDHRARRESVGSQVESLPSYRASRPPSYREEASPATLERAQPPDRRPEHNRSWSQHLMYSASGLGVAMSETSRRSLLYCLQILGRSAEHIATVSDALRLVLEQYDQARDHWHQTHNKNNNNSSYDSSQAEKGERPKTPDHDDSARRLAGIIQKHCDDIWSTLKTVVQSVSSSAGGALPINAREFVRGQLLSLPLRWRRVSDGQVNESETSRSAHRMVAFATEGLDMIGQVSQMCKATLDSAEGWVSMVGRRQREVQEQQQQQREKAWGWRAVGQGGEGDCEMLDAHAVEGQVQVQAQGQRGEKQQLTSI